VVVKEEAEAAKPVWLIRRLGRIDSLEGDSKVALAPNRKFISAQ